MALACANAAHKPVLTSPRMQSIMMPGFLAPFSLFLHDCHDFSERSFGHVSNCMAPCTKLPKTFGSFFSDGQIVSKKAVTSFRLDIKPMFSRRESSCPAVTGYPVQSNRSVKKSSMIDSKAPTVPKSVRFLFSTAEACTF